MSNLPSDIMLLEFAKAARDHLNVEVDNRDPEFMRSLAMAIQERQDLAGDQVFVAALKAAGIPWPEEPRKQGRQAMEYRVYEISAEVIEDIGGDEPSVGRNIESR